MSLPALIFQSMPESFAMLLLGLALTRSKYKWLNLIILSVLASLGTYFIRQLPIKYGMNTIIGIPYLILLLKLFCKLNFKRATLITAISLISLGFIEGLMFPFISLINGISAQEVLKNTALRIIFSLPTNLILISIGVYCYKKDIYIFDEDFLQR